MHYSQTELHRYSRQIILSEIGIEGQNKIRQAKVLIIGAGGLGSPAGLYLAAAGVGTLGLADSQRVDITNLQRQIAHTPSDLAKKKTQSFQETINALNAEVKVVTHAQIDEKNIADIIAQYHFILDGTDNFGAKFLINDACYFGKKPFSHGGLLRFDGQTMTIVPGSACYRCVFLKPPAKGAIPSCSEAGILGPVAGILGCVQATETIKWITGAGELLTNRLWTLNALSMKTREITIRQNPHCPLCGTNPSINSLILDEGKEACDLWG